MEYNKTYNLVKKVFVKPRFCLYDINYRSSKIFEISSRDIRYKTKFGSYRAEYWPTLTITIFGKSFEFIYAPSPRDRNRHYTDLDDYFEAVLSFTDHLPIVEASKYDPKIVGSILQKIQLQMGHWGKQDGKYLAFSKEFVKSKYRKYLLED